MELGELLAFTSGDVDLTGSRDPSLTFDRILQALMERTGIEPVTSGLQS